MATRESATSRRDPRSLAYRQTSHATTTTTGQKITKPREGERRWPISASGRLATVSRRPR